MEKISPERFAEKGPTLRRRETAMALTAAALSDKVK